MKNADEMKMALIYRWRVLIAVEENYNTVCHHRLQVVWYVRLFRIYIYMKGLRLTMSMDLDVLSRYSDLQTLSDDFCVCYFSYRSLSLILYIELVS